MPVGGECHTDGEPKFTLTFIIYNPSCDGITVSLLETMTGGSQSLPQGPFKISALRGIAISQRLQKCDQILLLLRSQAKMTQFIVIHVCGDFRHWPASLL